MSQRTARYQSAGHQALLRFPGIQLGGDGAARGRGQKPGMFAWLRTEDHHRDNLKVKGPEASIENSSKSCKCIPLRWHDLEMPQ